MRARLVTGLLVLTAVAAGCGTVTGVQGGGGDASTGRSALQAYGCGACHTISGISDATGQVGPALDGFGERRTIAGTLSNTPQNLARWIEDPQAISPGNLMPDLGVGPAEARDIAAYLESH